MSLRYALLGIISKKPVTGYDVVRIFKEQMIYFWNSTHSQVYTELHKMENEDLIQHELIIQDTSPNKKIYTLTDNGRKELVDWVIGQPLKPAKIKDEFLIKTSAFHVLTIKEITQLLTEVIEREETILQMTTHWKDQFKQSDTKQHIGTIFTVEYGIRYSEMYLNWCKWAKNYIEERFSAQFNDNTLT
ncbi:PadR family transcriptional regulator [Shouchella patagoniensis]|uniref:PadR family transcriptional regulator n=1 Tax=Shouchella patagoniensis TaxID=228576 RepID=UPI000994B9D2|nr:PadR family transcriptional regulator [Shouchella patagoniensis]